jgi:hypothetical protein
MATKEWPIARAEPDDQPSGSVRWQPKQEFSCLTSIFPDVSAAIPKDQG